MTAPTQGHTSSDVLVLQWRVRSEPGVPEREWMDTSWQEDREHGGTVDQAQAMIDRWRAQWPILGYDEEQRVVNRITHVTDYEVSP